ncbi:ICP22 [Macropodid alphaherpesvirus 4]|uniref:ICP22 n=1 Tax=Macropodid alphaherpesvirus 4 TaxID=2762721 RepID=A0A7L7YUR6_9ALPH|nr:ICP22 [Macropodid alphaherpesvirus 4]QOD40147.1 ICP22 [Macropodid alphaherpesvirus 4]
MSPRIIEKSYEDETLRKQRSALFAEWFLSMIDFEDEDSDDGLGEGAERPGNRADDEDEDDEDEDDEDEDDEDEDDEDEDDEDEDDEDEDDEDEDDEDEDDEDEDGRRKKSSINAAVLEFLDLEAKEVGVGSHDAEEDDDYYARYEVFSEDDSDEDGKEDQKDSNQPGSVLPDLISDIPESSPKCDSRSCGENSDDGLADEPVARTRKRKKWHVVESSSDSDETAEELESSPKPRKIRKRLRRHLDVEDDNPISDQRNGAEGGQEMLGSDAHTQEDGGSRGQVSDNGPTWLGLQQTINQLFRVLRNSANATTQADRLRDVVLEAYMLGYSRRRLDTSGWGALLQTTGLRGAVDQNAVESVERQHGGSGPTESLSHLLGKTYGVCKTGGDTELSDVDSEASTIVTRPKRARKTSKMAAPLDEESRMGGPSSDLSARRSVDFSPSTSTQPWPSMVVADTDSTDPWSQGSGQPYPVFKTNKGCCEMQFHTPR